MDIPLCLWLLSFAVIAVMGKAKWWQAKDTRGIWKKISSYFACSLGLGAQSGRGKVVRPGFGQQWSENPIRNPAHLVSLGCLSTLKEEQTRQSGFTPQATRVLTCIKLTLNDWKEIKAPVCC